MAMTKGECKNKVESEARYSIKKLFQKRPTEQRELTGEEY